MPKIDGTNQSIKRSLVVYTGFMKNPKNSYLAAGVAFVIASVVAIFTDNYTLFTAWLPIGVAFVAIGLSHHKSK